MASDLSAYRDRVTDAGDTSRTLKLDVLEATFDHEDTIVTKQSFPNIDREPVTIRRALDGLAADGVLVENEINNSAAFWLDHPATDGPVAHDVRVVSEDAVLWEDKKPDIQNIAWILTATGVTVSGWWAIFETGLRDYLVLFTILGIILVLGFLGFWVADYFFG